MKSNHVLAAIFSILVFAFAGSAQKKADFSGTWVLDRGKSRIEERARVESISMVVRQDDKTIRIDSKTVRLARPDGSQGGNGQGGGFGGGGGFGKGDASITYDLQGKELKSEESISTGPIAISLKARQDGEKLLLSSTRGYFSPIGPITATLTEEWTLSKNKKTLTVLRQHATPQSINSSTLIFVKK